MRLAIGDFSRATHMSVKTLRHYHRIGLLEPAEIDEETGYRRYSIDQIPTAQVIRRFRDLDMPLDEIRAVLSASEVDARDEVIAAHLTRLEGSLERTRGVVASLRDLLETSACAPFPVERRRVEATPVAAISDVIELGELSPWFQGAMAELHATLAAQDTPASGPPGGVFSTELFADEHGEATIYLPCATSFRATGRVTRRVLAAAELAIAVHAGSHDDVDRTYGALATYVSTHALAVDGPIREHYLVGRLDTDDADEWRTEIAWPIFRTGAGRVRGEPRATE
jgi:DNA-binding transcriptional MerR regulator